MAASSTSVAPATNQSLISAELWGRLVNRVTKDLEFQQLFGDQDEATQRNWAERIMEQTLGFLKVAAVTADGTLSPSTKVDIGWHTFLMYTREYADFCERVAGRMIHHAPSDVPGAPSKPGGAARATAAMQVNGMIVDQELWGSDADCADSGMCHVPCNGVHN